MSDKGTTSISVKNGIGTITFSHPKSNSLPGDLLRKLAQEVENAGKNDEIRVVVLQSTGEKAFCAGASFEELSSITTFESGKEFFMGFGGLIIAMKNCPKFIITRVQGKAVGGAVGIIAASDYVLAHDAAGIKLSELALGIGPFVIGPAVERKAGLSAFNQLSVSADWHSAQWGKEHGLYNEVYSNSTDLDEAVSAIAKSLSGFSMEAMTELKSVLWEGTEDWDILLEKRAEISGKLVLSEYTKNAIARAKKRD